MRTERSLLPPDAQAIVEGSLRLIKPNCELDAVTTIARAAAMLATQRMLPSFLDAQASHEQVIQQTLQDKMTGLDNQRGFVISLGRAATFAQQNKLPYTVACMYLTNLKHVNDTLGYEAGDSTLIAAAECLKASSGMDNPEQQSGCELRQAARLENGDDFGVILVGVEESQTLAWWQEIDTAFRDVNVEMCLGLSVHHPHNPQDPTEIFNSSYAALQIARCQGSGAVSIR